MFKLRQEDRIIIYGYNDRSIALCSSLISSGFNPIMYFDINASKFNSENSIPIVSPSPDIDEKQKCIVIIMLRNIVQHEEVVEQLLYFGYCRFICLPTSKYYSEGDQILMFEIYNMILRNKIVGDLNVPQIASNNKHAENFQQSNILLELDDDVVFMAPIESLYTRTAEDELKENPNTSNSQFKGLEKCLDRSVLGIKPYFDLYEYLVRESAYPEKYFELLPSKKEEERTSTLKNRQQLFNRFITELENGLGFFIKTAASGEYGANGKIVIHDGLHRIMFLLNIGLQYVPVKMQKVLYEQYMDKQYIMPVLRIIEKNKYKFRGSISHAAFKKIESTRDSSHIVAMKMFLCSTYPERFNSFNIIDISGTNGLFARMFYQLGVKESVAVANSDENQQYIKVINALHRCGSIQVISKSVLYEYNSNQYDMTILIGNDLLCDSIDYITKITRKYILVENLSSLADQKISDYYMNGFSMYKKMGSYISGGSKMELGLIINEYEN